MSETARAHSFIVRLGGACLFILGAWLLAFLGFYLLSGLTPVHEPVEAMDGSKGALEAGNPEEGAGLAFFFFLFLGYSALLLPIAFLFWGAALMGRKPITYLKLRLAFFPVAFFLLVGALAHPHFYGKEPFFGSVLGDFFHLFFSALPLPPQAGVLLLILLFVPLIFFTLPRSVAFLGGIAAALARLWYLGHRGAKQPAREETGSSPNFKTQKQDPPPDTKKKDPPPAPPPPAETARAPALAPAARAPVALKPAPKKTDKGKGFLQKMITRQSAQKRPAFSFSAKHQIPDIALLSKPKEKPIPKLSHGDAKKSAEGLLSILSDFGVAGRIDALHPGPVITLYEFTPAPGIKSSRVMGLSNDIARSMSAHSARVAVIPGQSALGIEIPNETRQMVHLRPLLQSREFRSRTHRLPLALGKTIGGTPVMTDLSGMPHLLVAGTTGSGKSVAINAMILSLLYRHKPADCRMIMIDPKMLELSVYEGIPHLLTPVVTDPKKAVAALKWTVREMERRYKILSEAGVRNVENYTPARGQEPMPYIVVIIDEMADLMLVSGKQIEIAIQRLAQMARAAGIHLIAATQRPSVDVITGTIKANFPTRISFQVTSRIDSRTILGQEGAEQLLGQGDMLFMEGGGKIARIHGPFVDDREVEAVASFLKKQGPASYSEDITAEENEDFMEDEGEGADGLYRQAVSIIRGSGRASTSFLQRKLQIGYNRAARLIEQMEADGIVSAPDHKGAREVLAGGD